MKRVICGLAVLLALLFLGLPSWAENFLKMRHVSEPFEIMGQRQSGSDEIVEIWLSGNRARMNSSDNSSVIFDGDTQLMFMLDHGERTYTEVPVNLGEAMSGMFGGQEGGQDMAAMMSQMMGAMMQVRAEVVDTGTTKTVNEWTCRVYKLTLNMPMGKTVSEICATDEIDVDVSMYNKIGHAMLAGQQGFEELLREMEKISGVAVLTVSRANVMGATMVTREELLEHRKKDAPVGIFDIPEGYVKQRFMGM
ncbi:DUF4412 domain-containing protein [Desulfonatronum thioautotrophicum]|uniref:DUF4412 domain-containing protein n=1 Tax=Desulfonatronum thioautotrophicum TaxID=617001 RepID=UPI0005EB35E7|nr:DUF4412 domain-containing protein [Desulfonatronum thioautotrophicum]